MIINNADAIRYLNDIKESCDADQHGGMMHYMRTKMVEMGFFDSMPENTQNSYRSCPGEWTAFQFAIFDNGEVAKPKRKRNYIERTKMRYGGQIKVWTRDQINFKVPSQIAWKANVYLWDHTIAVQVATELHQQKLVCADTLSDMRQMWSNLGAGWMYAIPVLKTRDAGTRWMQGHVLAVEMTSGKPGRIAFSGPGTQFTGSEWSEQDASGNDLADNVLAQMRLGRHGGFDAWSTERVS